MRKPRDLTNQVFGRLTAVSPMWKTASGATVWKCKCLCRKTCFVRSDSLTSGKTRSCGCQRGSTVGGNHTGKRLTQKEVDQIRQLHAGPNPPSQVEIAVMFGVRRETVCKILSGKTWTGQPRRERRRRLSFLAEIDSLQR